MPGRIRALAASDPRALPPAVTLNNGVRYNKSFATSCVPLVSGWTACRPAPGELAPRRQRRQDSLERPSRCLPGCHAIRSFPAGHALWTMPARRFPLPPSPQVAHASTRTTSKIRVADMLPVCICSPSRQGARPGQSSVRQWPLGMGALPRSPAARESHSSHTLCSDGRERARRGARHKPPCRRGEIVVLVQVDEARGGACPHQDAVGRRRVRSSCSRPDPGAYRDSLVFSSPVSAAEV